MAQYRTFVCSRYENRQFMLTTHTKSLNRTGTMITVSFTTWSRMMPRKASIPCWSSCARIHGTGGCVLERAVATINAISSSIPSTGIVISQGWNIGCSSSGDGVVKGSASLRERYVNSPCANRLVLLRCSIDENMKKNRTMRKPIRRYKFFILRDRSVPRDGEGEDDCEDDCEDDRGLGDGGISSV